MSPVHFPTVSQNEPLGCALPTDTEKEQWATAIGQFIATYSSNKETLSPHIQRIATQCGIDSKTLSPKEALEFIIVGIQAITPNVTRRDILWAIQNSQCGGNIGEVSFEKVSPALQNVVPQKSNDQPSTSQQSRA